MQFFFSRESDSTITNVCLFVRLSVCLSISNSLKSSSFIIHPSSFFIIFHSSFLHFATFKLFIPFLLCSNYSFLILPVYLICSALNLFWNTFFHFLKCKLTILSLITYIKDIKFVYYVNTSFVETVTYLLLHWLKMFICSDWRLLF